MENKDKEMENLSICRAKIEATKGEGYDFQAVAVPSENKQLRYSYQNDEYYYEVLRTGKENIDISRLDSGLPLFDDHPWEKKAINTLGITRGYEFTEEGIKVNVELGSRADEALRSDITRGIIKSVSIEGDIYNYSIERKIGEIPIYYAELWQPISLSLAPVPNDIGAKIEVKRALAVQIEKSKKTEQPESDSFINKLINKY
jgi:hypothetical protein